MSAVVSDVGGDRREQAGRRLQQRVRRRARVPREAERRPLSEVGLERGDVRRELRGVSLGVGLAALQAVLLVGEEDDADGAPRLLRHEADLPRGLDDDAAARRVVDRAGAEVPRVEVRAEQDDLLRPLAAGDLADDVGRLGVRQRPAPEREAHAHGTAPRRGA